MGILGFGDRVPRGEFDLHSAFDNALNFRGRNGFLVSLVSRRTGNGPFNIVLKHLPRGARRLKITRFYLHIDENRLAVDPDKSYHSSVPELALDSGLLKNNLELLRNYLSVNAPEKSLCFLFSRPCEKAFKSVFDRTMLGRMKKAAALMESGDHARGARAFRGLGFGLTPSGDDFLCGYLTGLNFIEANMPADLAAVKDAVYDNAITKNLVSNTLVYCAYNGRVSEKTGRLLKALAGAEEKKLLSSAGTALKSGHTSGADFCAGLVYGCEAGLLRVR